MDARTFFIKFLKETDEKRDINGRQLFDIYKNDAEFTPVIMKIINNIIDDAGYSSQNEYYRIDAVGWVSQFEDMKLDANTCDIKLKPHYWNLKVAVEHENSKVDWTDEVIKLVHIKCPLKVIISYNYCDQRGEEEKEKLSFVAKWMNKVDALNKGQDEEYLIILGNGYNYQTKKSDYEDFGYKGYLYDWVTKDFIEMEKE